jgi:predicted HicB family RNase H-like nuclease
MVDKIYSDDTYAHSSRHLSPPNAYMMSLRIPVYLKEAVKEIARRSHCSQNAVILQALEKYVTEVCQDG